MTTRPCLKASSTTLAFVAPPIVLAAIAAVSMLETCRSRSVRLT
jgi:hypothetical protein